MNKYISKRARKRMEKERMNHESPNLDDFKYNDEPTYKETMGDELEHESVQIPETKTTSSTNEPQNQNSSSSIETYSSYRQESPKYENGFNVNRSVFNESDAVNNFQETKTDMSTQSKWDKLKLIKLKEKIIEGSYISDSFFTNLDNNYNVLDLSTFKNDGEKQDDSFNLIKTLITKTSPVIIKAKQNDSMNSGIRKIFGLMQTSKADFGSSQLKMGWPFVAGYIPKFEGDKDLTAEILLGKKDLDIEWNESNYVSVNKDRKPKEGNFYYGPLLLWPVILYTRDRINFNMHLARKHGMLTVEVNSHIIMSLIHTNKFFENLENANMKVSAFVEVVYSEDVDVFVENIVNKYSTFGFKFNTESTAELRRILTSYEAKSITRIPSNDETGKELENVFGTLTENEFKILPFASIGTYPIANIALYMDYVRMIATDGTGFVRKIDSTFYNQLKLAEEYHKYFSETSLKEIVKLDFSQKKACNVALNDNLVISGAAGNGKSQTISSIIANAINNLKSVVFSTEKKEAANVIFNRLGRLRNYSLKLFESDNFAKDFTSQLKNGLERVSLVYGIKDSITQTNQNVVSEKLDAVYKRVNDFKSIMISDEGQNYPEYIFKKNKMKQELKEVVRLVGPILKHAESSSDFWIKINQISDDYNEFQQITKVKETLAFEDDLFIQVFNVIKYYDGNDLFFDNYLIQYVKTKRINEAFDSLPEEKVREFLADRDQINLANYATDPKALYWQLEKLFRSLDDYSIDIMKAHDIHWYQRTAGLVKQKSTELIIEFREKFSPDDFDYEFFHDYYSMEKFAADHGDSFQVDNENYYELIDNLITNKLGEDIRTTEFLFALKVTSVLKENEKLANDFNRLYALVKNTEIVNSVDDILTNYSKVISLIFPLILGSPSMIAKYVVCQSGIFDICIIDEASMIPLENAFPLLYRSNHWIVSGDIKQLPPATYQKNIEKYNKYQLMQLNNQKEKQSDDLMKYKVFETPISLLEYIGTKIQTVVLEYHYRSVKKELFEFSNVVFYRNMIHVADDQNEREKGQTTGINLKTTKGFCENGINKEEAKEVVRIVEEIVSQPNHGTIGIITTTNEQRDYIESLLLDHPSKLVTNEFSRISEDGEDNSLFVLTCEKVQGSERDNIIISFVASKNKDNPGDVLAVNRTLGILATEVGPNFLNVLITRSRLALYVINSFEIDELITDNNRSLLIFKDYIEYSKLLTENGHNIDDPKVQAIFKPYIKNNAVLDFSNDMKGRAISRITPDIKEDLEQVFAFEPRLEIVDGWYEGSVKIDLVIKDRKTGRNILGILCDEFIYDVMVNGKQRDFYNRKFLETRNWHFFALSSLQWSKVYKRQSIIDKIINLLTLNLANWKDALRITKIKKYAIDENGNVVIVDNIIKNSSNRLDVIEIEEPLYYEGDKELLNISLAKKAKVVEVEDENEHVEEKHNKKHKSNTKSSKAKAKSKTSSKPKTTSSKKSTSTKKPAKKGKGKK